MQKQTDILIVGGGPGGLACAMLLAQSGARVVLAERKREIGRKVCAGGITRHGLLRRVPTTLLERGFAEQTVYSPHQHARLREKEALVATVNREKLGQWMAEEAQKAGAHLHFGLRCQRLEPHRALLARDDGTQMELCYEHLVGADGSNSMVRRYLRMPTTAMGLGFNVMLPGQREEMEWHLLASATLGYGWIFPHRKTFSLGVYSAFCGQSPQTAQALRQALAAFAAARGCAIDSTRTGIKVRSGLINFDYRGFCFGRTWLIGDAAGLASPITGEGIYPAIASAQAVAQGILQSDPHTKNPLMERLIKKQRQHRRLYELTRRFPGLGRTLAEGMILSLRLGLLPSRALELSD